jgi:hypothetical protein
MPRRGSSELFRQLEPLEIHPGWFGELAGSLGNQVRFSPLFLHLSTGDDDDN